MFTKQLLTGLLTVSLSTAAALAQTNAPAPADYSWLAAKELPQPGPMLDAAFANLPKTIREKGDWLARMKKASWVPTLELRHGAAQSGFRQFNVVDAKSVSSSTETAPGTPTKTTTSTSDDGRTSYGTSDEARWVQDVGVYLTWDLSRLVFRSEELNVLSAEMSKESFRENVRTQVIQTYYDLKESLLLLENENFKDSIPTKIKKERLAFLLDTLTGGELSTRGQQKH